MKNFLAKHNSKNDFEVSIGSPHSIYSILENIIRNAAKHDQNKITTSLEAIINIKDNNGDYYDFKIRTNISKIPKNKQDEFIHKANLPFNDDTDNFNKTNRGILDIKYNAYIMNGITEFENYEADIKKKCKKGEEPKNEYFNIEFKDDFLTYCFRVPKAKKIVYIGFTESEQNEEEQNIKPLDGKEGIYRCNDIEAVKKNNENLNFNQFEFAVVNDISKTLEKSCPCRLPFRLIFMSENKFKEILKKEPFEQQEECWKLWLEKQWNVKDKSHLLALYNDNEKENFQWYEGCKSRQYPFDILCVLNNKTGFEENVKKRICEDKNKVLLFSRHGAGVDNIAERFRIKDGDDTIIPIDASSNDFSLTINSTSQLIPYRLAEAALMRILVIDERIGGNGDAIKMNLEKAGLNQNKIDSLYWASNVIVASKIVVNGENTPLDTNKHSDSLDTVEIHIKDNQIELYSMENSSKEIPDEVKEFINTCTIKDYLLNNGYMSSIDNLLSECKNGSVKGRDCAKQIVTKLEQSERKTSKKLLNPVFDVVIVHRTYIGTEKIKDLEIIRKSIKNRNNTPARVILTSGGGIPSNIKGQYFNFISIYDIIPNFSNKSVAKMALSNLISSAKYTYNKEN